MVTQASTRHLASTRGAILAAASDLFVAREGAAFSVREVADRAGVTHRTIYRHFPTRADLLTATARDLASDVEGDLAPASTVDEWIASAGHRFEHIEGRLEVLRGVMAAILTTDDLATATRRLPEADDPRWGVFRKEFPHLDETEARRAYAALRHVLSSVSYFFLRVRFGMPPQEAAATLCESASRIVAGLPRRPLD